MRKVNVCNIGVMLAATFAAALPCAADTWFDAGIPSYT